MDKAEIQNKIKTLETSYDADLEENRAVLMTLDKDDLINIILELRLYCYGEYNRKLKHTLYSHWHDIELQEEAE